MRTATEINLAQLFRNRAIAFGDAPRWRQRHGNTTLAMTWRENQTFVNSLISGLDALGAHSGDVIGILSNTRWEWTAADWAILGLGATSVTIYPSNTPDTVQFILNDSGARFLFAEDRAQYEKLLTIRDQIPEVRRVILFDDADALTSDSWLLSFDALRRLSPRSPAEADAFAAERAEAIQPSDLFTLVYTSGTTGRPKGVIHSHATFMAQLRCIKEALPGTPGMSDLLFLPLSHVFGREEHLSAYDRGVVTTIVPSLDHLIEDLATAAPDLFFSVPRVYEKAYAAILAKVAADKPIKQRIFAWAARTGREVVRRQQSGQPVSTSLRLRHRLADRLVFQKIRALFGGKLKYAVTAGAPLEREILDFFNAAGVLLLEGWGLTETSGGFAINRPDHYRLGTVGLPYSHHEIRIAGDGEILVRGPCIFLGYHNNPAATAEVLGADGWFATGDIGSLDADGYLCIVDRKKDLLITAGGKNIAPQLVENALKTVPCVSQAVVYGDRKPYLVAVLTLDLDAVRAWAAEHDIAFDDVREVYRRPDFRAYLDEGVQRANSRLARYETVKYYTVLPEDFTVENDMLTPSLKIRRRIIHQHYHDRFEALYRPTPSEVAQHATHEA